MHRDQQQTQYKETPAKMQVEAVTRAVIQVRLRLALEKLAIPNLFLANALSLANKKNNRILRISNDYLHSCVTVIRETWFHENMSAKK